MSTSTVVPFQPRVAICAVCQGPHRPEKPWHQICQQCLAWSLVRFHHERLARALKELQR